MEKEHNLVLKHQQKLIITPQLKQCLYILQLPAVELQEIIQQELSENPLLAEQEKTDETRENSEEQEITEQTEEIDLSSGKEEDGFTLKEWEDYFESESSDLGYTRGKGQEDEEINEKEIMNKPLSLLEHLMDQLRLTVETDEDFKIGEAIIGNLNDEGYLAISLEELAQNAEVDIKKIESVLQLIQTFDPAGVGARNLQECLLIQLRIRALPDNLPERILLECWEDFEQQKTDNIALKLQIDKNNVQKAIDVILKLNPKPGRNFSVNIPTYVIPDIIIEKIDKELVVKINDEDIPLLQINRNYVKLMKSSENVPSETKKFIEEKFQSAIWLLKGIEQRRKNLYRLVSLVVDVQKDFFEHGITHVKALTMKEIAIKLGLHQSTISRLVMHKYAETPQGLLPLRFFFSSGLETNQGTVESSKVVKESVREFIENEDAKKPLTDHEISRLLMERGVKIARRTVAKYREELQIPKVNKRKNVN